MRANRSGPRERRRGPSWIIILCILLMVAAIAGCSKEQTAQEGIPEEAESLPTPSPPAPEAPPQTQADPAEEPAPKYPKIRFEQEDHDFGKVEAGDEVKHIFVFENVGDAPLFIKKVLACYLKLSVNAMSKKALSLQQTWSLVIGKVSCLMKNSQ